MSTDFNKKGRHVAFMARKDDTPYYSILVPKVIDFANAIESEIAAYNQDPEKSNIAGAALGCFERFRGCILYIWRISQHEESIKAKAPQNVGEMVGFRGAEVLIDFESLLFHGRSSLDRTAFWIAKKIYGQDCDKFPKLSNILANFEKQDHRATDLLNVIKATLPLIDGVLCDTESGKKSLRSHLIHKSTASENAIALFTLHYLADKGRIAFDAILGDYSLFGTTQKLINGLTYFLLNALSIYIGTGHILELADCESKWHSKMVDYRLHESDEANTIGFTVWSVYPAGCILKPVKLCPSVCNKVF